MKVVIIEGITDWQQVVAILASQKHNPTPISDTNGSDPKAVDGILKHQYTGG